MLKKINSPFIVTDKGSESFDTLISHDWADDTTWPSVDNSEWIVEPSAVTKQIKMVKSEVQFSHDVQLATQITPGGFYFDIWVYNPLFNDQLTIDADDPTFVPWIYHPSYVKGNSPIAPSIGNPLRFLYKRTIFYGIRDVFNYGNDHFTMDATVDGVPSVTTVKFNYDQSIILRGDQGMQVRFSLKDHAKMGGTFVTVSVVVREEDIPS
jgi:hypothetical protein